MHAGAPFTQEWLIVLENVIRLSRKEERLLIGYISDIYLIYIRYIRVNEGAYR